CLLWGLMKNRQLKSGWDWKCRLEKRGITNSADGKPRSRLTDDWNGRGGVHQVVHDGINHGQDFCI
ncbi:hypothetical protein, partial [Stenotrophomonas sp. YIM B06876]|uniref:hypothetical protein n=1 Tax=Stenotrophomonas sp. YIM B06876 TaxID=3060211 RepID=UPI002739D0A1